jgi:hypothetical protein
MYIVRYTYNGGSIFHTMSNWCPLKSCLALVVPSTISLIQGRILIGRVKATFIPVDEIYNVICRDS